MANLRSKIIRLAHTKPELRAALLPLLANTRKANWFDDESVWQVRKLDDELILWQVLEHSHSRKQTRPRLIKEFPSQAAAKAFVISESKGAEPKGESKTASVRKPLYGHTDMNSAYLVEDYPYGFKLRTQARFWLEYKPGKGYRFISQTMDPKRGVWNKPKASTYIEFAAAMYLDEKDHVQWTGLGQYSDAPKIQEFLSDFPGADKTILKKFVPMKVKFYTHLLEENAKGLSGWKMNGVTQPVSEADIGRNRKELEEWTDVVKKL